MPKLQEKPSALKREHPALQNMKILYSIKFFKKILFSMFVGHSLLDQDPATQINADPDPKPCLK